MEIESVFIRVSTAKIYGNGHFTRAVAVLKHLKKNFDVQFITDNEISEAQKIIVLKDNIRCISTDEFSKNHNGSKYGLIIDHYALSLEERDVITSGAVCSLEFDDRCELNSDVDIRVVPIKSEFRGKNSCTELVGLKFAVIDDRFVPNHRKCASDENQCLINFGSFDGKDMTLKVLKDMAESGLINKSLRVVCLVPKEKIDRLDTFKKTVQYPEQIILVNNVEKMWKFLPRFDFSICSGGRSLLENLRMGVPSIVFETDTSQTNIIQLLNSKRAILFAGDHLYTSPAEFISSIKKLGNDKNYRKSMAAVGSKMVDGKGAERLVDVFTSRLFSAKI